ncbi:MAG: DEAD/DEAH box helicase [Parachlamydia sp.]|jgi:superfamily II DNA or RNA helicase|nr:DEAD/DEAH box helicase [Parachlamydia sp.]
MQALPSLLKRYEKETVGINVKKAVRDIEFSGPTYQVLVADPASGQEAWVFMQLEPHGEVKDIFCSCEEGHESGGCLHQAIAYRSLYDEGGLPLHHRFSRSLWNQLCALFEDRLGGSPSLLKELHQGRYVVQSSFEKVIFSIKANGDGAIQHLEKLLHDRRPETEETSLKFSNLSLDEILLWREGRPSPGLRYDLSFWSDLAKWLLRKQEEGEKVEITFRYAKSRLPNWIQIAFSDVEVGFYLSAANLPAIIPYLASVNSPLSVKLETDRIIEKVFYDKNAGVLHIVGKKGGKEKQQAEQGSDEIPIDGWIFIPDVGFYTNEPHVLLQHPQVEEEELSDLLSKHHRLLSNLIVDAVIHKTVQPLSYRLYFDAGWNLHIAAYLFEEGDLQEGDSRLIGDWAYLDQDGFYPIEKRFSELETVIPIQDVSDFISQNRTWMNGFEGFETHVKSIEYQLSYRITENNRLVFTRTLAKEKENKIQDFGVWVYLEEQGFYSKTAGAFNHLLKRGMSLSAEQIPLFIQMNKEELALVPQFFSDKRPIEEAGVKIHLLKNHAIGIEPVYTLTQGFELDKLLFFDEFVYMEGEGFYEMPPELRLPEEVQSPVELEGEERDFFLAYELEALRPFVKELDPRLQKPATLELTASLIEPYPEKGRGWYRLELFYKSDYGKIPLSQLHEALIKKEPYAFFEAGMVALKERQFDWLRRLEKERFLEGGFLLLSTLEMMRLNAFDPIKIEEASVSSQEHLATLITFRAPDTPDLKGLDSRLRSYQMVGVEWLWFLYHQQLSGLLCDDMGLGKTHQAMALMASIANFIEKFAEGTPHFFLIVCPTSVLYHWQEKLQRFLPSLRVCTFYGLNRSLEGFNKKYDILLTSYGILRNQKEQFADINFELAIFDEIQVAKNQMSLTYVALKKVKAQMKLGLTGTPIENHLRELKSLFDIVLPSYMPGEKDYRELFIKPIEKEQNFRRKDLLNRLIRPFTLRRKKEEVLTELPEKMEEISHCDLSPVQQKLYIEVLEKRRRHLIEELQDEHNTIPFLHIFSLLSSLKQICNHPAVYLKCPQDYQKYPSGKWNLFIELLNEARQSNQKVVIFSQYLGMLDIIQFYLEEQGIGFSGIRGSTQDRREELRRFNEDPSCEVFVGSLQAAGLGIDLTAGSVVIHYDRWWNAARENQATDRVHRIGQTRGVQVFKLVTLGTFEEKINAMIDRKGQLMEDVVGVDDQSTLKKFTREELMELLTYTKIDAASLEDDTI